MSLTNILLAILFALAFLFLFLPVGKWTKKLLDIEISQPLGAAIAALLAMGFFVVKTNGVGLIYIVLATFCVWAFIFGFLSNRKYPYTLALVFLAVCPFLLMVKMEKTAEFFAVLCYLCLVLGVLKDLFYEKLVK